jgi:hypothetical protein
VFIFYWQMCLVSFLGFSLPQNFSCFFYQGLHQHRCFSVFEDGSNLPTPKHYHVPFLLIKCSLS